MTAKRAKPISLVIFGISGDLAQRKLLPALEQLAAGGYLPTNFKIIGLSRQALPVDKVLPASCSRLKNYLQIYQIDPASPKGCQELKKLLPSSSQKIFYLAVPPAAVLPIIHNLGSAGLNDKQAKLLLEKPFGTDYQSAKSLVAQIDKYYDEDQVYRIDHFLAKEAAQNIAVFLGSNAVFREVWNKNFIEYVEIVAAEQIGIENRVEFWEATGTLRDFVQSHLLQLAALVAMTPCDNFSDFERLPSLRLEALKKFKAEPAEAARAQYGNYKKEASRPKSKVETFAAVTLRSRDPRWQGVPFYLATGKKLNQKLTEIRVQFKKVSSARPNRLVLRIQPKEAIEFDLWVKQPGPTRKIEKLSLDFSYEHYFKRLPDAYEHVLLDVLGANHSLFASSREVLQSWRILQPILDNWSRQTDALPTYKAGSSLEGVVKLAYNRS